MCTEKSDRKLRLNPCLKINCSQLIANVSYQKVKYNWMVLWCQFYLFIYNYWGVFCFEDYTYNNGLWQHARGPETLREVIGLAIKKKKKKGESAKSRSAAAPLASLSRASALWHGQSRKCAHYRSDISALMSPSLSVKNKWLTRRAACKRRGEKENS